MLEYVVQEQHSMIALASNNSVWAHEGFCWNSVLSTRNKKRFIVTPEPIPAGPAMIKVIMAFPSIYTSKFFHVLALLAYNYVSFYVAKVILNVSSPDFNVIKQGLVKIEMNWFLIVQKYKVIFRNIIPAKVKKSIWVTTPWRVAEECSSARLVIVYPRPKSVVVNFIYSNHV